MGKAPSSLNARKEIIERHLFKYGPKCPSCDLEGDIEFDRKDNRPFAIALQAPFKLDRCGRRFHFDHIIPTSKNGSQEIENYQLLCPECNLKKGIDNEKKNCR